MAYRPMPIYEKLKKPLSGYSSEERFNLINEFIEEWHDERTDDDGIASQKIEEAEARLGLSLPLYLKKWYVMYGNKLVDRSIRHRGLNPQTMEIVEPVHVDSIIVQNHFLSPSELHVENEMLIFYAENQWCSAWAFKSSELNQDDPPVYIQKEYQTSEWIAQHKNFTEFLFPMNFLETIFGSEIGGNGSVAEDVLQRMKTNLHLLPVADWKWPGDPTRFYFTDDLLVSCDSMEGASSWIWFAAKDQDAFEVARDIFGDLEDMRPECEEDDEGE